MCEISLRTGGLAGASTGGVWTFNGFHPTNQAGPFDPEEGTDPGALSGDNPTVDFTGFTPGFYSFNYAGGEGTCAADVDIVIAVIAPAEAGCSPEITICTGEGGSDVSLLTLKNDECEEEITSENLVITVQSGSPGGAFNSEAGTIDLEDLAAGTYVFLFTKSPVVPGGYTLAECEECADDTATLTIIVSESFNPGTPNAIAVCP